MSVLGIIIVVVICLVLALALFFEIKGLIKSIKIYKSKKKLNQEKESTQNKDV